MRKEVVILLLGMLFITGCVKESEKPLEETTLVSIEEESGQEVNSQEEREEISWTEIESEKETKTECTDKDEIKPKREFEIKKTEDGREICKYGEVEVLIPEEWVGKYTAHKNENELSFYYMGGLLGKITISENESENWYQFRPIAYTEQYVYYYVDFPSGSCLGDEEEFKELREYYDKVIKGTTINAEGVHYDADEYYLPLSASKETPDEVIRYMPEKSLFIARNEIYARHGRKFENPVLQEHFASCSWYVASVEADAFDESVLSEVERINIDKLRKKEQAYKEENEYIYPNPLKDGWSMEEQADGSVIYKVEEITFTIPAEWKEKCVVKVYNDSISIYSKKSYEFDCFSGYVCGIGRTKDERAYMENPEASLIQEANGYYYYFSYPTDVPYVQSGIPLKKIIEISEEYNYLMGTAEQLSDSVVIGVK